MRYVGASNWTIRLPFILEGAIASGIGSILSCVMLSVIVHVFITGWLAQSVTWIPYVNQMTVLLISPFLVVGAVLLSVIASTILCDGTFARKTYHTHCGWRSQIRMLWCGLLRRKGFI